MSNWHGASVIDVRLGDGRVQRGLERRTTRLATVRLWPAGSVTTAESRIASLPLRRSAARSFFGSAIRTVARPPAATLKRRASGFLRAETLPGTAKAFRFDTITRTGPRARTRREASFNVTPVRAPN